MSGERASGDAGERTVEQLLRYGGWTMIEAASSDMVKAVVLRRPT